MIKPDSRIALSLLFLCGVALSACKPSDASPAPKKMAEIAAYDMRGVIEKLGTEKAPRVLVIRHEASKDMESMAMPFSIDEAVSIKDLAVGDKIAFRYEMDLNTHVDRVTKVDKLPVDTALNIPSESAPASPKP